MKSKILFFVVMLFSFTSVVLAIEDYKRYTMAEFIENMEYNAQQEENNYIITVDNNETITVTYNETNNSIVQTGTFEGDTPEEKIANSWLLKHVLSLSSIYTDNRDTIFTDSNVSAMEWGIDGEYCNLEDTGVCYETLADGESIEVSLSNMTARYIYLATVSGTGISNLEPDEGDQTGDTSLGDTNLGDTEEEGVLTTGERGAADPVEYEEQEDPETYEEAENPDTGIFTQYAVIGILLISLVFILKYMKKNEVKYKI